jgi:probable F420-dependent oxidoreductase
MKIGFGTILTWFHASPVQLARAAERLGFESMWMGEHLFIPVDIKNPYLYGVELPPNYKHMPDPFIWLTAAAAVTSTLKLGMNVCLVPQREPLLLAKQVACLDRISNGRFIFGIGAGWIEEEAEIMGYPFNKRWAKTMEGLRALKALWTEEKPNYAGEYVAFPPVYSYPKPVQQPHPPIIICAGSAASKNNIHGLRRVAELGDGWAPIFLSPAQMVAELTHLKELCAAAGRDYNKLDINVIVPAVTLGVGEKLASLGTQEVEQRDPHELIAEYEAAGVSRIIIGFGDLTETGGVQVLEDAARILKLQG